MCSSGTLREHPQGRHQGDPRGHRRFQAGDGAASGGDGEPERAPRSSRGTAAAGEPAAPRSAGGPDPTGGAPQRADVRQERPGQ